MRKACEKFYKIKRLNKKWSGIISVMPTASVPIIEVESLVNGNMKMKALKTNKKLRIWKRPSLLNEIIEVSSEFS